MIVLSHKRYVGRPPQTKRFYAPKELAGVFALMGGRAAWQEGLSFNPALTLLDLEGAFLN